MNVNNPSPDESVKISSADSLAEFLKDKLVAGTDIVITELDTAGVKTLEIKSTVGAVSGVTILTYMKF